ncbi:MAG: DUF6542 domain-containing protein [Streptomyces sp.]
MDQQHNARSGRRGPGPGREQGQDQGQGPRRRTGAKPRAAAAAAAAAASSGPVPAVPAVPVNVPVSPAAPSPQSPQEIPRLGRGDGVLRQESAVLYRAQARYPLLPARLTDAFSWLPSARLTALGSGLLAVLLMMLAGSLDALLLGGSFVAYGAVFILVSVICAAWVRPAELFTAPIAVPIAFTLGVFFISGGTGNEGLKGHLMGLFPALALNAVWLYAGTLAATLVAFVRKLALLAQAARARAGMEAPEPDEAGAL